MLRPTVVIVLLATLAVSLGACSKCDFPVWQEGPKACKT
jgi:hypothetical protein